MLPYCLKCRKNIESKNPKVARTKNGRIMFLSKCAVCDSKESKFTLREKCPNAEFFLVHKIMIKNANFFVLIVSCFRTHQRKKFTMNS